MMSIRQSSDVCIIAIRWHIENCGSDVDAIAGRSSKEVINLTISRQIQRDLGCNRWDAQKWNDRRHKLIARLPILLICFYPLHVRLLDRHFLCAREINAKSCQSKWRTKYRRQIVSLSSHSRALALSHSYAMPTSEQINRIDCCFCSPRANMKLKMRSSRIFCVSQTVDRLIESISWVCRTKSDEKRSFKEIKLLASRIANLCENAFCKWTFEHDLMA